MQVARNPRRRSPHVAAHADFRQGSRVTVAVARSRRFGAIARRNAAEREQNNSEFTTLRLSESKDRSRALPSKSDDGASRESFRTCSSMTEAQPIQGTAKVKPRRGLIQNAKFTINGFSSRVRFQRCHSEEQSDEESVFVSFSRFPPFRLAGRSLGRAEARKRAPQAASEIIHNAFSCKTFARAGCGGRAFSASRPRAQGLPYQKEPAIIVMLSEAKHLFWARLQILRRSAPQNDKLLNCSQTPQQTGICNWRQRGKVEGKDVRGGRSLQS